MLWRVAICPQHRLTPALSLLLWTSKQRRRPKQISGPYDDQQIFASLVHFDKSLHDNSSSAGLIDWVMILAAMAMGVWWLAKLNVTRGKVNAFELRGCENSVSLSQSEQKAFVFELSNDLLIGQSAVRLSNRKHSLSFQPHYFALFFFSQY